MVCKGYHVIYMYTSQYATQVWSSHRVTVVLQNDRLTVLIMAFYSDKQYFFFCFRLWCSWKKKFLHQTGSPSLVQWRIFLHSAMTLSNCIVIHAGAKHRLDTGDIGDFIIISSQYMLYIFLYLPLSLYLMVTSENHILTWYTILSTLILSTRHN